MQIPDALKEIPYDELMAFKKNIKVFNKGQTIISEGETNDKTLFLVRIGEVGVYRLLEGTDTLISNIQGINFFGEMELIIGGNRLATIKAMTENVILYVFKNPKLNSIIANPMWGEKLVSRLSQDLKTFSNRVIEYDSDNKRNLHKMETLTRQITLLLSLIINFQNQIGNEAVLGTEEWKYLIGIREMTQNFINSRLPEIQSHLFEITPAIIDDLKIERIVPKKLQDLL